MPTSTSLVSVNPEAATKAIGAVGKGLNTNPLAWLCFAQLIVAALILWLWVPDHIDRMESHQTRQIDRMATAVERMADVIERTHNDDRDLLRETMQRLRSATGAAGLPVAQPKSNGTGGT